MNFSLLDIVVYCGRTLLTGRKNSRYDLLSS